MNATNAIRASTASTREAVLTNPWLMVGRVLWLLVVVATIISFAALAERGSRALLTESNVEDSYAALSQFISYRGYTRLIMTTRYLVVAIFVATGLFIFWRKSNTVMGLVASIELMTLPLVAGLGGKPPYYPETLNLALTPIENWANSFLYGIWLGATILFIALFPSGRFPFRRMVVFAAIPFILIVAASVYTSLVLEWREDTAWVLLILAVLSSFAVAVGGAVYRYFRVSTPVEKQQTRWVMASLVMVAAWSILFQSASPFRRGDPWAATYALVQLFGTVIVASLVPLSIARAITRYKLWDVDVVIRKTLVYSLLSGALILIYLASVLTLQRIFRSLSGQDSELVTILSTLLIAALFLPLRRRIQDVIDRRFFRSRYDAARVLDEFASAARDETDLDTLTAELLRVIQDTMQPEHLSIWLREESAPGSGSPVQQVTFQRYGTNVTTGSSREP